MTIKSTQYFYLTISPILERKTSHLPSSKYPKASSTWFEVDAPFRDYLSNGWGLGIFKTLWTRGRWTEVVNGEKTTFRTTNATSYPAKESRLLFCVPSYSFFVIQQTLTKSQRLLVSVRWQQIQVIRGLLVLPTLTAASLHCHSEAWSNRAATPWYRKKTGTEVSH